MMSHNAETDGFNVLVAIHDLNLFLLFVLFFSFFSVGDIMALNLFSFKS